MANEDSVKTHNLQPLVRLSGWATVGVNPEEFDVGAVEAVKQLLHDQGLKIENVDLFEVNITQIEKGKWGIHHIWNHHVLFRSKQIDKTWCQWRSPVLLPSITSQRHL